MFHFSDSLNSYAVRLVMLTYLMQGAALHFLIQLVVAYSYAEVYALAVIWLCTLSKTRTPRYSKQQEALHPGRNALRATETYVYVYTVPHQVSS